jgi:hypothetical protein
MKKLKSTSVMYNKYTRDRVIVNTTPLTLPCDNKNHELYVYAEFFYNESPNMSLLVLKSDIAQF